jgi:hypothetical protein
MIKVPHGMVSISHDMVIKVSMNMVKVPMTCTCSPLRDRRIHYSWACSKSPTAHERKSPSACQMTPRTWHIQHSKVLQQVATDTYCSCSRTARTRASARVRGLTVNYLWTVSLKIWWAHTTNDHKLHGIHTYHVQSLRACASVHVRARVWLSARSSLIGFSSNLVGT